MKVQWYGCDKPQNESTQQFGVYTIHLVKKSGKRVKIGRLLETDRDGILYIGCSEPGCRKGMAGRARINATKHIRRMGCETLSDWMDSHEYGCCMVLTPLGASEDIKSREHKRLAEYKSRFGELPPFNSTIGKGGLSRRLSRRTKPLK